MSGNILPALRQHRIIVALRGVAPEQMAATAKALYAGGIRMLEVTFNQASATAVQDTCASIEQVRSALGNQVLVGAGTVLTAEQARAAVAAGAEYLLSPHFDPKVVEEAVRLGVASVPGAFTPSEIAAAWAAGAAFIKLFPADSLGTGYIKAITAPLNHIPLLAMGGVNESNLTEFLDLPNMAGVGIGSNIAKGSLIQAGDWDGLTELALRYTRQLTDQQTRD